MEVLVAVFVEFFANDDLSRVALGFDEGQECVLVFDPLSLRPRDEDVLCVDPEGWHDD